MILDGYAAITNPTAAVNQNTQLQGWNLCQQNQTQGAFNAPADHMASGITAGGYRFPDGEEFVVRQQSEFQLSNLNQPSRIQCSFNTQEKYMALGTPGMRFNAISGYRFPDGEEFVTQRAASRMTGSVPGSDPRTRRQVTVPKQAVRLANQEQRVGSGRELGANGLPQGRVEFNAHDIGQLKSQLANESNHQFPLYHPIQDVTNGKHKLADIIELSDDEEPVSSNKRQKTNENLLSPHYSEGHQNINSSTLAYAPNSSPTHHGGTPGPAHRHLTSTTALRRDNEPHKSSTCGFDPSIQSSVRNFPASRQADAKKETRTAELLLPAYRTTHVTRNLQYQARSRSINPHTAEYPPSRPRVYPSAPSFAPHGEESHRYDRPSNPYGGRVYSFGQTSNPSRAENGHSDRPSNLNGAEDHPSHRSFNPNGGGGYSPGQPFNAYGPEAYASHLPSGSQRQPLQPIQDSSRHEQRKRTINAPTNSHKKESSIRQTERSAQKPNTNFNKFADVQFDVLMPGYNELCPLTQQKVPMSKRKRNEVNEETDLEHDELSLLI